MKRRYIYGLLLIAVVAVLFLVVRSSVREDQLVGTWELSATEAIPNRVSQSLLPLPLILRADGTYQRIYYHIPYGLVDDAGTWAIVNGNRLKLTSTKYGDDTYIIKKATANELVLNVSGVSTTYTYSKSAT